MKSYCRVLLFCALALAVSLSLVPVSGFAQVPKIINYQGYLTDPSGNAVKGSKTVTVSNL